MTLSHYSKFSLLDGISYLSTFHQIKSGFQSQFILSVARSMNTSQIIALSEKYVMNTYARYPVAFVRGEGCYLWDAEGKKYLDLLSGIAVNALGYNHPAIREVIVKQSQTLVHTSNLFYIHSQAELAQLLCENSFADKVFFCNSGAESNETAAKLARRYGKIHHGEDCFEIITMERSFHGRTFGMIAATGQDKVKKGFEPLLQGFRHVPFNDLPALKAAISPKTCAIMLEAVQGEGGIRLLDAEYLQAIRKICDESNLLLIFDEVQTGLGRTGKLFAYQHYQVKPDILTLAKSLGTSLPIGVCMATDKVASAFKPGDHATTFGGGFLVCEAAKKFLEILLEPSFLKEINQVGEYLMQKLSELQKRYSFIRQVRGKGLMIGAELSIPGKSIVEAGLKHGLVLNCVQDYVLRFVPPLILQRAQVDEAIEILDKIFAEQGS